MTPLTRWLPPFVIATSLYAQLNTVFAPGSLGSDGTYQVGNGVSPPVAIFRTACEMPDLARKLRLRGDVALMLVIKADGTVGDTQITKSAGYGMDERAADCVRNWRFRPGTRNQEPVDVAFQFQYTFSLVPQPTMWGAGPLIFPPAVGVRPPTLKSGAISNKEFEPLDETVLLRFTVSPEGKVEGIQTIEGRDGASVSLLTKSLSTWKFAPASTHDGPIAAVGEVLFIKGKDYFRYKASSAFRDSARVSSLENDRPSNPAGSTPVTTTTVQVPLKIELVPEEAEKLIIYRVSPQYPSEAKLAGIEGRVSLMVTIGKDGVVIAVNTIAGPAQLLSAAVAAVKQWRYKPILFKGEPQVASTVVDIPFKLSE